MKTKGKALSQNTLKLYLNACAALAETTGAGFETVLPLFRQVTEQAPHFEGGWRGLLTAEGAIFSDSGRDPRIREQLQKDITAARKVNPNLIEILRAEIDLLPYNAFAERMRLADRAVELGPDDAVAYATRSQVFHNVGRMSEAVEDAGKAVQLDPLSPPLRDNYISALLYSGQLGIALQELDKAERLWPGASSVRESRLRINVRYGDAQEALRMIRSDPSLAGWGSMESFLEARIDPSPAKVEKAIDDARNNLRDYARYPDVIAHVAQVYGEFGREKELLDIVLRAPPAQLTNLPDVIFRPALVDFWNDPGSLLVAKRIGLLQFWQQSGKWPDFCDQHNLPYDCKKEAAKLLA